MNLLFLILLTCNFLHTNSSKILIINSTPAHSHYTIAFRLAEELTKKDHQVTFVTPFPSKRPKKNIQDISLEDTIPDMDDQRKSFFKFGGLGTLGSDLIVHELSKVLAKNALTNANLQKLLKSAEKFDVVIIEHFLNEALVGIGYHFQAPIILLTPTGMCYQNNYIFRNPSPPSYVPDLFSSFSNPMNFWQRLENFLVVNFHGIVRELLLLPTQRQLFKKYINSDLQLDDVLHNVSLILSNSHPSVSGAVPHLPNIIEIGGYHLSPPKKLPPDLQYFLDNSEEVVVFSMGTNLKSEDLSVEVRNAILTSFSKIKAKVLWKFGTDLPEVPKNVKIMSWFPQQDVLAHRNVKCFITHGGLLSITEAVYFGVPLIGIPIFVDQYSNVASAVGHGYALSVPLGGLTEKTFFSALKEILDNPKYLHTAKQRSKFMQDQPINQTDLAVYWVEHVIRHGGTPYLKSAATGLRWYQRESIDVLAFLGSVMVMSLVISYWVLQLAIRWCRKINVSDKKYKKR